MTFADISRDRMPSFCYAKCHPSEGGELFPSVEGYPIGWGGLTPIGLAPREWRDEETEDFHSPFLCYQFSSSVFTFFQNFLQQRTQNVQKIFYAPTLLTAQVRPLFYPRKHGTLFVCKKSKQIGGTFMIVVNTEFVAGHEVVRTLGLVQGNTVRTKHVGRDWAAGIKSIFGGELRGYTELLNEARKESMNRMIEMANKMGANAVLGVRFTTSTVMAGASELYCFGTAVVIERKT
jgi:uncharacterized protein YbjQ (UPF0145 family)